MAYEKLNLPDGTVLNEEHLAHFEEGIEQAVSVTPQTITADQQHQARLNIRCGSVGEVSSDCVASGTYSHAEGYLTKARGSTAHAEGRDTFAWGNNSHAEGSQTSARGDGSHAEGSGTRTEGAYSHAEGYLTTANGKSQHVQGEYNIEDTEGADGTVRGKYAHIVGNGTSDARSNAHTLDWAGVPWFAGDRVMLGGTGMDDENAVALMPVFVPQTLTEEQKLQSRVNMGITETVVVTADVIEDEQSDTGFALENVSMSYADIKAAWDSGADVSMKVTFGDYVYRIPLRDAYASLIFSVAYLDNGAVAVLTAVIDPFDTAIFEPAYCLTEETSFRLFVSCGEPQDLTDAEKTVARANIGAATVQEVLDALPTWEGGSY